MLLAEALDADDKSRQNDENCKYTMKLVQLSNCF